MDKGAYNSTSVAVRKNLKYDTCYIFIWMNRIIWFSVSINELYEYNIMHL